MSLRIRDVKYVLRSEVDIDPAASLNVAKIDALVFTCISAAQSALDAVPPQGFTEFERDHLKYLIEGQRYGHQTIRMLLRGDQHASAVDALLIARLQLEVLYSLCFMLQGPQNVQLFLKNGWKRKYIRFLLQREEHVNLPRFSEYHSKSGQFWIDQLQACSCVSAEERRTIEQDELGSSPGPSFTPTRIESFPTPRKVIERTTNATQKRMLERLYPEYQFLCSFVHGDLEATLFRVVSDRRSRLQEAVSSEQVKDFYQRQVSETPIVYSAIAAVQAATEVAAMYPSRVDLLAELAKAWNTLLRFSLLAVPVWELRARDLLNVLAK